MARFCSSLSNQAPLSFFARAMVVFTVDFKDATERSLARLFLQQFAGVQKQVAQSPHIEFRRSNDPPKEILDLGIQGSSSTCSGFISFTFFPSHVKTTERKDKAVELMVNFFPYLDKHVKSTKTYMHIRMRSKKNDLLRELKERVSENQCVKKGSPLGRKNVPLTVPSGLNDSFLRMSHGRGKAAL
jgi:actin related protein 2/3 complex subunit 2